MNTPGPTSFSTSPDCVIILLAEYYMPETFIVKMHCLMIRIYELLTYGDLGDVGTKSRFKSPN